MWKDLEKHEYVVGCATCGKIFLSPDYQPETLWYILGAQHWLQNPTHEVILYEDRVDGKTKIICWSVEWRRSGIINLLREIQFLRDSEKKLILRR